jgi:hypothetical protein
LRDPALADAEEAFRRAGLPAFIAERTARADVWTKAVPLLALVFGAEALGALDLSSSVGVNALLLVAGGGLLLAAVVALNAVRRRPLLSGPDAVGRAELVGFVAVPALLPLVLNGQVVSAAVTAAGNALLLALVYPTVAYGAPAVVVWSGRRLVGQLATAATLVARALPLLLLSSVVLFINTEMWQAFALMGPVRLAGVLGLFVATSTAFLLVRLPREVSALEREVAETVPAPALDRRERVNVGLVMFVSQGLQVLVVAAAVAAFFVVLGLLAVPPELQETWTGRAPDVLASVGGVALTAELVRIAAALAGLAGFSWSIAVLTDSVYREEFATELTDAMRASFRERAAYRERRERLAGVG